MQVAEGGEGGFADLEIGVVNGRFQPRHRIQGQAVCWRTAKTHLEAVRPGNGKNRCQTIKKRNERNEFADISPREAN